MSNTIKGFRGTDGPILLDFSGVGNVPGAVKSIAELHAEVGDFFEVESVDAESKVSTVKAVPKPGGDSGESVNGLTADERSTLIAIVNAIGTFSVPNGQELMDAFNVAWGNSDSGDSGDTTEKTLTSISATYSGGSVAVGTAVTALTGVVVTANYSDGSTATVTGYTLSGTIAEGENTITVSYGGKTTTIAVTGVAEENGGAESEGVDILASTWTDGLYIDHLGAESTSYSNYTATGTFDVSAGDILIYAADMDSATMMVRLYDADGIFFSDGYDDILESISNTDVEFVIPTGATSMRLTGTIAFKQRFTKLQLVRKEG